MTTVGFFNPLPSLARARLIRNLGVVLADAGFRVVLVDLDSAATLSELTGALDRHPTTMFDAFAGPGVSMPDLVDLEDSLLIAAADPRLALIDSGDASPDALREELAGVIAAVREEAEAAIVLCAVPATLGPLARAAIGCASHVWVPVSGSRLESYVGVGLAAAWAKWNGVSMPPRDRFDWIEVHAGHDAEAARVAAARFRDALGGTVVGHLKEFPTLSTLAGAAHKPEVALTTADGASESQLAAVADLRHQHEVLATALLRMAGTEEDDAFREQVEQALYSALSDEIPAALATLSSGTSMNCVADVEMERLDVRRGGVRVAGTASVSVDLHWGGRSARVDGTMSFPMRFDLDLDRSHASANQVTALVVDTSSFYE